MTIATEARGFAHYFRDVEDTRIDRTKFHKLVDILFISVAATIAGADGPSDIADFAKQQLTWCGKFVRLKNGVPSHDTIGRVLSLIKPEQFQVAFLDWIASFTCPSQEATSREVAGSDFARRIDSTAICTDRWKDLTRFRRRQGP